MAPADDAAAISQETIDVIEGQVKKGKARKFFLIFKGGSIQTLCAFKKGKFAPKVTEAKKNGFKGEVAYGVLSGSGKNLFFQFAGSPAVAAAMKVDGFSDSVPVKKAKVKDFLAENGLEFKPVLYCITDASLAPDPESEDDLPVAPPPASMEVEAGDGDGATTTPPVSPIQPPPVQPVASNDDATSPPPPPPTVEPVSNDAAVQFMQRLKAAKPEMDRLILANTPVSNELKQLAAQAALAAREKRFDDALLAVADLESKIQEGLQQMAEGPGPELGGGMQGDPGKEFNSRLKELVAQIKQAGSPAGDQAKQLASTAGTLAKQGNWKEALEQLDAAAQSLANANVNPPSSSNEGTLTANELTNRLKDLRGRIDQCLLLVPSQKQEFYGPLTTIVTQTKAGNLQEASSGLQKLTEKTDAFQEQATEIDQRLKELEPKLQDGKNFKPEEFSRLTAAYSIATGSFGAGDFNRARQVLERLEPRVEQLLAAGPGTDTERMGIREGIVAEQRDRLENFFRQRFAAEMLDAQSEVQELSGAVQQMEADHDPQELADAILAELEELYQQAVGVLVDALATGDPGHVYSTIAGERDKLKSNELIMHLQSANNSLGVDISILERFDTLFEDVRQEVEETLVA